MIVDHQFLLLLALSCLAIANVFKQFKFLSIVGLACLVINFLTDSRGIVPDSILHHSIDFVMISILAMLGQFINLKRLKFVYIPIVIFLAYFIHPFNNFEEEKETYNDTQTLDQNMELMILLKDDVNINKWIKDNQNKYEIKYPLFTPRDKSTSLDEFIGINTAQGTASKVIEELEKNPSVSYVETNEILELKLPSTGTQINKSEALQMSDPNTDKQWLIEKLKIDDYHKLINKGQINNNKTSIIAILDTGVEADHEDLQENYISIDKSHDRDTRGHGTHCAGIAAAVTGNNIGIASLLPPNSPVKVTAVKVLSNFGIGSQAKIIEGMIEAADYGVSVISMSLGAITNPEREVAYAEAVQYTNSKNIIVVVSAGNSNADAKNYSPANTPGVISVSAIGSNFTKASFSNYTDNLEMGIAAPGKDIYSTFVKNKYSYQSGTSMSAPFVAGLIGLMKHYDPNLNTREAYKIIKTTAFKQNGQSIINPYGVMELILK